MDVLRQRARSDSTHPGLKPRPRLTTPPPLPFDATGSTPPPLPFDVLGSQKPAAETTAELNRRISPRRPIRVPVDLIPVMDPNKGLKLGPSKRGICVDLSEEGLLLTQLDYLQLGSVVRLFVRLPDRPKPPMATDAKVVRWEWRGEAGYGLKFIEPDPSDIRRIQRLTWQ